MTVYPFAVDTDTDLPRVDDNVTEVGGEAINALRSSMFAVETELGINPAGSAGSVAARLNTSLNPDGTIKASALTAVGLATLPIVDSHVASNAGIKEYKLDLDYSTADLHTLILANTSLLNTLSAFATTTNSDLNAHIDGATLLADGSTLGRHVASHIDLNDVPEDTRDPSFVWAGLKDKDGVARTATNVGEALDQINTALTSHENATIDAHLASAIKVDVSDFTEIPSTANTAQKVFDYLDDSEVINMGLHRATQHANAIPRVARSQSPILPDGYRENIVPPTLATAYLVHAPNTMPVDDLSVGDDIIKFTPTSNTGFVFDAQFSQVQVGDVLRINYGNGLEAAYPIESIRFIPGSEWLVRINGVNLADTTAAFARVDRARYDRNTAGILAVAAANPTPTGSFTTILSSVIVGHPRAASVLGLGFDSGQLDSTHYKLWLELYPTGNPTDKVISLPAIDVTGNAGATPGNYDLESVVQATNNAFRRIGYNYRFIAFAHEGEFGLMLADTINNASFAIVEGTNSSGTLSTGTYTENVIGGSSLDTFDALGLGTVGADVAGPAFLSSFTDATAALLPTKIIVPLKSRDFIVNGQRRDNFAPTYLANSDGYWDGYISARTAVGIFTVETTYTVLMDLEPAELKPGKTIVVQPAVEIDSATYFDVDYGRFIIKSVNFVKPCGASLGQTQITVINGIHATGNGFGASSGPSQPVRLYFSEDSVSFNIENVIDQIPTATEYARLHEIYINQEGKTFSHERARMPRQSEDAQPSFLGTTKFHIKDVSPKLRGYRDSDPTLFNKYVRFFVTSYNSTSGEYDGYLGQRPSSSSTSILKYGPITTARKNVPARFYDETGVDFIELEFEDSASPGTAILSTAFPRFVDIEIFPTLQTHDELLLLATCEVNWDPVSGQDVVQHVLDKRQFGSVDELDFTSSALDFISAADRYLHENGVIRGFAFDFVNSSDNREVSFKGGVGIVNGRVVLANNQSVTIPQVYPTGSSLPQTVTWAVCVTENGSLQPIIITSSKQHFFATPGSGNYYIPSVTFSELINTRKDLLPIYLVTATIASFTISDSDVEDVRRLVASEGSLHPLVWSTAGVLGHFSSFTTLKNWINSYGAGNNLVKVRGAFTLSSSLDLTGFTTPVIFEGEGASFTTSASKGFLLGSDVTIRNIDFIYRTSGMTFTPSTNKINVGNGCLYAAPGTSLSNILIEKCRFSHLASLGATQRPPFILFELSTNQTLDEITIRDNTFLDGETIPDQAAIAFVNLAAGGSSTAALVSRVFIERNRCNYDQGIYVTDFQTGGNFASPGISALGCRISNNTCGVIGVITSGLAGSTTLTSPYGIDISGNTCHFIGSLNHQGQHVSASHFSLTNYGTGDITVTNNFCSWIHFWMNATSNINPSLIIQGNRIIGYDSDYLADNFYASDTSNNMAIYVNSASTSGEKQCQIIGNDINRFADGTDTYAYTAGIYSTVSSNIIGNNIRGIEASGYGMFLAPPISSTVNYLIQGNQIYRGSNSITSYIYSSPPGSATTSAIITDNFLDSTTINGTITVLFNIPSDWITERNRNQTKTFRGSPFSGTWGIGSVTPAVFGDYTLLATTAVTGLAIYQPTVDTMQIHYNSSVATNNRFPRWHLQMDDVLPKGVYITKITIDLVSSVTFDVASFTMALIGTGLTTLNQDGGAPTTIVTTGNTLTLTVGNDDYLVNNTIRPLLVLFATLNHSTTGNITINSINIDYRW